MKLILVLLFLLVSSEACDDLCFLSNVKESKVVSVEHCPVGWVRFKDSKCFKLFTESKGHPEAEKTCSEHGSTLASIHSDEERLFLVSYVMREVPLDQLENAWIGLENKAEFWFWTDLSQFSFINWWPGHPRLDWGACGYLVTKKSFLSNKAEFGKTAIEPCASGNYYICQKHQQDSRRFVSH